MSIPLGTQPSTGIQRGRGGFLRSADDKPYVSDPSGATVKYDGNKPDLLQLCKDRGITVPAKITVAQLHDLLGGRPKRIAYGSPSNRGKRIENTTNLVKWGERRVVLGIGLDPEIVALCQHLATLEVDSDEYKTTADAIIIRAKDVAKANLAAQRGTHVHALTEDFDESRDWVLRAEAGEIVGLDRELQDALVAGWHRMLQRFQLEVLAVEASCVDDTWRLAGTLDRIVRLGTSLRFRLDGGVIVEIPAGTVPVLDVKTSNKRLDNNGCVQYWQAFAIQIASYAQSVPYDTETEVRGEWPWPISQEHALIAHPDLDTCEWELIYVDLYAGREHGGRCVVDADAWEKRTDVFSVAQLDVPADAEHLDDDGPAHRVESATTGSPSAITLDSPAADLPQVPVAATAGTGEPALVPANPADDFDQPMINTNVTDTPGPEPTSPAGEGGTSSNTAAATGVTSSSPDAAMGAPSRPVDVDDFDAPMNVTALSGETPPPAGEPDTPVGSPADVDDDFDTPMPSTIAPGQDPPASPARAESLAWINKPVAVPPPELVIDRDEGSTVHLDTAFNEIETLYATLTLVDRQWVVSISQQAMNAGVSFHAHGNRTERRYWIIKALVMLGLSNLSEDEVLRALVAAATKSDAPLFQATKPGHAVGALGATDAQTFANLVDQMHTGQLVGAIDDGGAFVLRPVAA